MPDSANADKTLVMTATYNEIENLPRLVDEVFAAVPDVHVLVVDDNSPDGTGRWCDERAAADARVCCIHRSGKLGLGTAIVAGMKHAIEHGYRYLVNMDADFSHPPALVPRLLAMLEATEADVVVASRYVPGGSTPNWPFRRRVLSRAACLLARPLTPIRDAASGFFVIRRDIVRGVRIQAGGFKICLELLVRAWPQRLVELPYQFDDRELGESKMSLREAAGYLVQLRDLYWLRLKGGGRERRSYRQLTLGSVESLMKSHRALGTTR